MHTTIAKCEHCGEEFTRTRKRGPKPRYCSDTCKARACDKRRGGPAPSAPYAPRSSISFADCKVCGELFIARVAKRTYCYTDDCERAIQNERVKRHYRDYYERTGQQPAKAARSKYAASRRMRVQETRTESVNVLTVYERDGWQCGICSEHVQQEARYPDPLSPSLDHVLPLSLGGTHTYDNVRLAHLICNTRRGNRIDPAKEVEQCQESRVMEALSPSDQTNASAETKTMAL